jgi:hypothetical protein
MTSKNLKKHHTYKNYYIDHVFAKAEEVTANFPRFKEINYFAVWTPNQDERVEVDQSKYIEGVFMYEVGRKFPTINLAKFWINQQLEISKREQKNGI